MLDLSESFVCKTCGTVLPAKDGVCLDCQTKDNGENSAATAMASSMPMGLAIAMLTFPLWGTALLAWANKAIGVPSFFQYLVLALAIFSPMPIVLSKRLGVLAKMALVFGYYWFAVPVAIFTMMAVAGQA